jgi:hypothetical protein
MLDKSTTLGATTKPHQLHILIPFHRQETMSTREAASFAGVSIVTARLWATRYGLGRRVGGPILLSKPALLMHLENDRAALRLYQQGERLDPRVARYFERCGIDPVAAFRGSLEASFDGRNA